MTYEGQSAPDHQAQELGGLPVANDSLAVMDQEIQRMHAQALQDRASQAGLRDTVRTVLAMATTGVGLLYSNAVMFMGPDRFQRAADTFQNANAQLQAEVLPQVVNFFQFIGHQLIQR